MFRSPPHCNSGSPCAQQQKPNNMDSQDNNVNVFRPGSPRYHSSPRPNRFNSPNSSAHQMYGHRLHGNMYPPQNHGGRSPRGYTPRSDHNRSWHERSRGGHSPFQNSNGYVHSPQHSNDDISQYFSPTMLEDPWQGVNPVQVSTH